MNNNSRGCESSFPLKVIIITVTGARESIINELCVESISAHYDVELWDLSYWIFPLNYDQDDIYKKLYEKYRVSIKKVYSKENFEQLLSNQVTRCLLLATIDMGAYCRIYKSFRKFNYKFACVDKENVGHASKNESTFHFRNYVSLKERIKTDIKHSCLLRYLIIKSKYGNVKFDYALSPQNYFPTTNKHHLPFHYPGCSSSDFQVFNREVSVTGKGYAVFIDTALANHPGYEHNGMKPNFDLYLSYLNRYFNTFEDKTGFDIVVAAYPKVHYDESVFSGRKVLYDNTEALIRDADVIIAHTSSALNHAILMYKPINFIIYDEMFLDVTWPFGTATLENARLLGQPCDNMTLGECSGVSEVDEAKYRDFAFKWIIASSVKHKSNDEIMLDFLNKHANGLI